MKRGHTIALAAAAITVAVVGPAGAVSSGGWTGTYPRGKVTVIATGGHISQALVTWTMTARDCRPRPSVRGWRAAGATDTGAAAIRADGSFALRDVERGSASTQTASQPTITTLTMRGFLTPDRLRATVKVTLAYPHEHATCQTPAMRIQGRPVVAPAPPTETGATEDPSPTYTDPGEQPAA